MVTLTPHKEMLMAKDFRSVLIDEIAGKTASTLLRRKKGIGKRIEQEKELIDPSLGYADDLKRVLCFIGYVLHTAVATAVLIRQTNLTADADMEYDAFSVMCDALGAKAATIRNEKCLAWIGGFRSSIVATMTEDRAHIRRMVRDLLPALFTPEEMEQLRRVSEEAGRMKKITGMMLFVNDLHLSGHR